MALSDKIEQLGHLNLFEEVEKVQLGAVIGERLLGLLRAVCKSDVLLRATSNCASNMEHLMACDVLIDWSWEMMNTGHWKEVKIEFRYLFAFASLIKARNLIESGNNLNDTELASILIICDKGLMMAPPICNNILSKVATSAQAIASVFEQW